MAWIRIRFICEVCGKESWFEFDNEKIVLVHDADWFICDDCNPCEEIEIEVPLDAQQEERRINDLLEGD